MPKAQGNNPARRGRGDEFVGPQKEDTGGDASFAPHAGLPRGSGPAGPRGGAGARGVRAPALPDRGRLDRDPHDARPARGGDLLDRQQLALAGAGSTVDERAPLPRPRPEGPSRRLTPLRRLARGERGTALVEFGVAMPKSTGRSRTFRSSRG